MKRINDLTWQEWKEAIENNSKLAGALEELAVDNAEYWIDEYLQGIPAHWQIGNYGYTYLTLYDDELPAFEEWFARVQRDYCLFNSTDEKAINEYIAVAEEYYTGDFGDDDQAFLNAEKKTDAMKEYAGGIIHRRLMQEYNIDTDVLLDFVDEWGDHTFEAWENVYLLDDYGIVEHIPRKVIEAHEVVIA